MVYLFLPVTDLVLKATMTLAVRELKGDEVEDVIDVLEGLAPPDEEGGGWTT